MKNLFKVLTLLLLSKAVFGQLKTNTYKANFSGAEKRITIMSANMGLEIVGIDGNEVIIEALEDKRELPVEAAGLKIVSPGGGIDNTGVGANVIIEGNNMNIKIPKSKYYGNYVIKIPKDVSISVRENGNTYGKWLIKGMKGEVETETSYSTLNIKNVSGPIVAHGGYGKIYVEYDQLSQNRPNSIMAIGAVDITLPADSKANLKVQSMYADFFTDFDISPAKIDIAANDPKKNVRYTIYNNQQVYINGNAAYDRFGKRFSEEDYIKIIEAETLKKEKLAKVESTDLAKDLAGKTRLVTADEVIRQQGWDEGATSIGNNSGATIGTINGGGVNLVITSNYGNVYLRKKK